MPMVTQNKNGAILVDKSELTLRAVGSQLLPFLIGGGSGIVSTTLYVVKPVNNANSQKSVY